jgi:Fe-Mn family superoxide dismutase
MGEETVTLHYELTRGYFKRANKLIRAKNAGKLASQEKLEFELSGARLHKLWWENLRPVTPGRPARANNNTRRVADSYEGGGMRELKRDLVAAGMSVEGSGWVALVGHKKSKAQTAVITLKNHRFAWRTLEPLLLIDVWEHAYICEYGGDRKIYLQDVLKLVDWAEVARRLS